MPWFSKRALGRAPVESWAANLETAPPTVDRLAVAACWQGIVIGMGRHEARRRIQVAAGGSAAADAAAEARVGDSQRARRPSSQTAAVPEVTGRDTVGGQTQEVAAERIALDAAGDILQMDVVGSDSTRLSCLCPSYVCAEPLDHHSRLAVLQEGASEVEASVAHLDNHRRSWTTSKTWFGFSPRGPQREGEACFLSRRTSLLLSGPQAAQLRICH